MTDTPVKESWNFCITGTELENVKKWLEEHKKTCEGWKPHPDYGVPYHGAIGGAISYQFTPTSLGDTVTVICQCCKEEKNCADFSDW